MKITDFFKNEFSEFALYDSFRSICNCIDGLKNSSRKVVFAVEKFKIESPIKVSSLAAKTIDCSAYLHGQTSLEGVIVGLAQNFPGSNNINLLKPEGSFGNRIIPAPAASRYIYTCKSEYFDKIFNKEDKVLLENQNFEGEQIEPKFYVPIVPLILINGAEGIGTGFAQKILPRNPKELLKIIQKIIKNEKCPSKIIPWFKGFKGTIEWDEENQCWKVYGKFEKVNQTTLIITELPIGYDLEKYIVILKKLEEQKIISNFIDKSEDNKFLFEVKVSREFLKDEKFILEKLKLVKTFSENFTCIDRNNSIIEFKNEIDLLKYYVNVRLEFYNKRKNFLLDKIKNEISELENKFKFIYLVVNNKIVINKKTKKEIEEQCEQNKLLKKNDSYDYLVSMPIYNLTKEKIEEYKKNINSKKTELEEISNKSAEDFWIDDLKDIGGIV